jgi:hypothetical protein
MRKPALFVAAAILTMSGAVAATKSLTPASSVTALPAPTRVASADSPSQMMAIVPAPVIDANSEVFVGTGDAAGGGWTKP